MKPELQIIKTIVDNIPIYNASTKYRNIEDKWNGVSLEIQDALEKILDYLDTSASGLDLPIGSVITLFDNDSPQTKGYVGTWVNLGTLENQDRIPYIADASATYSQPRYPGSLKNVGTDTPHINNKVNCKLPQHIHPVIPPDHTHHAPTIDGTGRTNSKANKTFEAPLSMQEMSNSNWITYQASTGAKPLKAVNYPTEINFGNASASGSPTAANYELHDSGARYVDGKIGTALDTKMKKQIGNLPKVGDSLTFTPYGGSQQKGMYANTVGDADKSISVEQKGIYLAYWRRTA